MFEALNNSALTNWLGHLLWGFPIAEIFHLIMLSAFVGGIMMLDLRLLGINKCISTNVLLNHILPCCWWAFAGVVISGSVLFLFMPLEYANNPSFRIKLILMVLGGLNALWMHRWLMGNKDIWDVNRLPPALVRLSAFFSLAIWCGVLACGRLIAYYYGGFY